MSETNSTLPQMGFASDLDLEERTQLGSFGEFLTLNEGETLIHEGDKQDGLFLIIMGSFHVVGGSSGRPTLLGTVKAGNTVGEINIFDPDVASASVVSKSMSEVWKIDRVRLEQYLEAHPRTAARVLVHVATQLSKRLRAMNKKLGVKYFFEQS